MPEIKDKTLSEVKKRLELAMARLDKAVFNKSSSFEELKKLEEKKRELETLEFNLITDSKKKGSQLESIIKNKDEIISSLKADLDKKNAEFSELNKKFFEVADKTGSDAGKVAALERENEILRNMLQEEKAARSSLHKTSEKVSEQLDLLIDEVDKIITEKVV